MDRFAISVPRVSMLTRDNEKLRCHREITRRFVSLNILLSHPRSPSVVRNTVTLLSRPCWSPY